MDMPYLILFVFSLLFSTHAVAENKPLTLSTEDKEKVYLVAEQFADCAGVFKVSSAIFQLDEKNIYSKHLNEVANGAETASSWLLFSMGVIKNFQSAVDFSEQKSNTEMTRWLGVLEVASNKEEMNRLTKQSEDKVEECKELNKFQADLVNEARRFAYENASDKKSTSPSD